MSQGGQSTWEIAGGTEVGPVAKGLVSQVKEFTSIPRLAQEPLDGLTPRSHIA